MKTCISVNSIQFSIPREIITWNKEALDGSEQDVASQSVDIGFTSLINRLSYLFPADGKPAIVTFSPPSDISGWNTPPQEIFENGIIKESALFNINVSRTSEGRVFELHAMELTIHLSDIPDDFQEIESEIRSRLKFQESLKFNARPVLSESGNQIDLSISFPCSENKSYFPDPYPLVSGSFWKVATEIVDSVTKQLTAASSEANATINNKLALKINRQLSLYYRHDLSAARLAFNQELIQTVRDTPRDEISLITAVPGIGKTYSLNKLGEIGLPGRILILVPRHELKANLPDIPTIPVQPRELKRALSQKGLSINSRNIRSQLPNDDVKRQFDDYMKERASALNSSICCSTHADFFYNSDHYKNFDTVIFDEDFASSMLKLPNYSQDELQTIIGDLQTINHPGSEYIQNILNSSKKENLPRNRIKKIRVKGYSQPEDLLDKLYGRKKPPERYELEGFLQAKHIYLNSKSVYFDIRLHKKEILRGRRVIVLSATPDTDLLGLLGMKINHVDIPKPHILSEIQYRPDQNISKTRANEDATKAIHAQYKGTEMISYKTSSSKVHFGASSGGNWLAGKDLLVLGTPFPSPVSHLIICHELFGHELVEKFEFEETALLLDESNRIKTTSICDNPAINRYFTRIALNEVVQAAGRCRPYEHVCKLIIASMMDTRPFM